MSASATLPHLARVMNACTRCPLYAHATQAVAGEGPRHAPLMLVGEQPGDSEDVAGRPFVGPAGRILDEALVAAGIPRSDIYLTNAVKHFKWEPRGKRRIHTKPSSTEILACRPWLAAEIDAIRPQVIVPMGATALHAVLLRTATISSLRGAPLEHEGRTIVVTVHPSSILRAPKRADRAAALAAFTADLALARDQIAALVGRRANPARASQTKRG